MKAQHSHRFELEHSKHNAEIKVFLCGILISKYFLKSTSHILSEISFNHVSCIDHLGCFKFF